MSDKKTTIIGSKGHIDRESMIATLFLVLVSVAYLVCSPIGVDMDFHVLRIGELGKELGRIKSFSDFPIYMYRDVYYHFGYPIPIFYCALFLYPFAALVWFGIEVLFAYKIMVLTLLWATFFICKICVFSWSKNRELAFKVAFIYAAQPYFLMDLFVKASIGEAFAFLFVPVVTLGYLLISRRTEQRRDYINGIIILAFGVNGIICSHVISTIMVGIVLVIVFLFDLIKKNCGVKLVLGSVVAALLCLGLSLWYILPMIEQLSKYKYHAQLGTTLSHAPQNVLALFIPMHLSIALSAITGRDVPLSEAGGAPVIILLLLIILAKNKKLRSLTRHGKRLLLIYFALVALMSIGFVWIPLEKILGFMQFTWRIYFVAALVGVAFIIELIQNNGKELYKAVMLITMISSVYVLVISFGYFFARDTLPMLSGDNVANYDYKSETTDVLYIPQIIAPEELKVRNRTVECSSDEIVYDYEIDDQDVFTQVNIFENKSSSEQTIHVPYIMYEGYCAVNMDSHTKYVTVADENGMVSFTVLPHDVGSIMIRYIGTNMQRISLIISIIMFMIAIICYKMLINYKKDVR